ncbi:MAG: hypothetical protein ACI837_002112 [Crocinitomicaceae bacterium]|jgi:hypothetical protein
MSNQTLFDSIATRDNVKLVVSLDSDFHKSLNAFRSATSKTRTLNDIIYPVVYLPDTDYGGLTIQFDNGKEIRLIVNLQYYYVYGFFLDDSKVYAFSGEGVEALDGLGFETTTIPFGDGYYDIKAELTTAELNTLLHKKVELSQITGALTQIIDTSISFKEKPESILIAFWSLVEGIRFAAISNVVGDLVGGKSTDHIYDYFYGLAEIWSKLCMTAYYDKELNPHIAVYDLNRVH